MVPYVATIKHAPKPPRPGPEDPGPFSFSDEARVRRILEAAGFTGIALTSQDFTLDLGVGEGLESAVDKSLHLGPAARALDGQPNETREAARREVRAALAEHVADGQVRLGAAIWVLRATA
jgi:hypothetical protein